MKNKQFYVSGLLVLLSMVLFTKCSSPAQTLFEENGGDWFTEGDATWEFEDDVLVGRIEEGAGLIMTNASYGDFELELDFKPDSTINSGVFVRCKNKELSNVDCYEINIWDLHPNQESRTGAVVTRSTPMAHVETLDKWSTYKIRNEKDHLQVWIDGVLTADLINTDLVSGPIALQAAESGEIRFRNVKVRPL